MSWQRVYAGQVAVVTGAASGIGLEMVKQLRAAGASIVAADIDTQRLEQAAAEGVTTTRVDTADVDSIRGLVDGAIASHGRIDFMFNNAGIGGRAGEVRDLEPADWQKIVDINLLGVIHGSTFAYQYMREQGSGHIVNTASAAGLLGTPQMIPYGTTKAAVVAFSRDFRSEAETFGVRVSVLCPGFVESRIFENISNDLTDGSALRDAIPLKFVPTDRAVTTMLTGVAANKSIITLPGYVRLAWLARRLFPNFVDRLAGRRAMKIFRSIRKAGR